MAGFNTHGDDAALVRRIRKGRHGAFKELLRRYRDICYRIAWRQLHSRDEAEDVVQTVFTRIWSNPEAWNEERGASFSTWLYRVTLNAAIDVQRRNRHINEPIDLHHDIRSNTEEVSDGIYRDEQQQLVIDSIRKLPQNQQHALNLVYYQQLSIKQAAEVLQTTPKAVESLLGRARVNLKQYLELETRLDEAS